jgi:hypothetical protein
MELQGFLVIQWPAIHAFLTAKAQLLDQNGDGKLDAKDVQAVAVRGSSHAGACVHLQCTKARF